MTSPLPPEIILPGNRPAYINPYTGTYTTNRSYAMRMQRGYARGLPQYEARGQRPGESARRRERYVQQYGQTPWQRYSGIGGTFEQRYPNIAANGGYTWYRSLRRRWLTEIDARTDRGERAITPVAIEQELANASLTGHDKAWIEDRLAGMLEAIRNYQDDGDNEPGYTMFHQRDFMAPVEWWWYH
jgi:hypothetical protein